jgi:hypothetical protein
MSENIPQTTLKSAEQSSKIDSLPNLDGIPTS